MTDPPPRLIPYCRQSLGRLGETRETSLSLDAQTQVIADWAAASGFVVAPSVRDHDLKGDDPDRPGLAELDRIAQPGDTIGLYKWDRLARDVPLQETLVRKWQARGVQVISVTEPSTRLTRVIYGAVNEEFRDALAQRIRDTRKLQAMRGHYIGADPPFGYRRSHIQAIPLPDGGEYLRPTGILTIAPDEAEIVRDIFERAAAGVALFAIAADLDRRGVPTRRGSVWQITTVRRIVTNRWYYGGVTYKGEEVGVGLHEPLIDRETWERANRLITRPVTRQKKHAAESWLEGYAYHACGRRMYLMSIQTKHSRVHYTEHFACQSAYQAVKCGLPRRHIAARRLEEAVLACLAADLSNMRPVADALADAIALAGGKETARQRQQLDQRRTRILTRYERVRDAWAAGMESLDWLAAEQAKRDAALAEIDAELAVLPVAPDPERYAAIGARLATLPGVLTSASPELRTALLAELGTVEVNESGVIMRYAPELTAFFPTPHSERIRQRG